MWESYSLVAELSSRTEGVSYGSVTLRRVTDLVDVIAKLKNSNANFRNEMEAGPGGRQIQLLDPDGNPIELFESARH